MQDALRTPLADSSKLPNGINHKTSSKNSTDLKFSEKAPLLLKHNGIITSNNNNNKYSNQISTSNRDDENHLHSNLQI